MILEINHDITTQKQAERERERFHTDSAANGLETLAVMDENQALNQTQEALMRAEKLRAVGELASGVAHNVNNVLTAVLGYAELIQGAENVTPEIRNYARTIQRAALDGAEVVRRMQRFARKEAKTDKELFALTETVREALDLTRPAWHTLAMGRGIQIQTDLRLDTPMWVLGSASEIREVFVNLITNAVHAMPEGGTLSVHSFISDDLAVVEVSDTGIGMDEQVYKRIFEPFFTTKGPSLGTGLGLSVAWGILTQHRGRIDVQSAPGAGAVFRVSLPLAASPAPSAAPSSTSPAKNAENTDTMLPGVRVLLVEDEALVLEGVAHMLRGRGAQVTPTSSASEALQTLAANPSGFDLILSDHGMVGLTGLELLAQVRAQYPHLRRVLLSGWGANLPAEMDTSASELVLAKPIHRDCLITSLASLLASTEH